MKIWVYLLQFVLPASVSAYTVYAAAVPLAPVKSKTFSISPATSSSNNVEPTYLTYQDSQVSEIKEDSASGNILIPTKNTTIFEDTSLAKMQAKQNARAGIGLRNFSCTSGRICRVRVPHSLPYVAPNATIHIEGWYTSPKFFLESYDNVIFYGVPFGESSGIFDWELDDNGNKTRVPFEVIVHQHPPANHHFKLVLKQPTQKEFIDYPHLRLELVEKLGEYLNQKADDITIEEVTEKEGHALVHFYNNRLPFGVCLKSLIDDWHSCMSMNKEGHPRQEFLNAMADMFNVENIYLITTGVCKSSYTSTPKIPNVTSFTATSTHQESSTPSTPMTPINRQLPRQKDEEMCILLIIFGFAVFGIVTFSAASIAFCSRRHRKAAEHKEETHEFEFKPNSKIAPMRATLAHIESMHIDIEDMV